MGNALIALAFRPGVANTKNSQEAALMRNASRCRHERERMKLFIPLIPGLKAGAINKIITGGKSRIKPEVRV
jgi:hypothetical protein